MLHICHLHLNVHHGIPDRILDGNTPQVIEESVLVNQRFREVRELHFCCLEKGCGDFLPGECHLDAFELLKRHQLARHVSPM
jgi:hypothetical protein